MGAILELAEALWKEETDTYHHHPFSPPYGIEQIAEGTWFYKGVSNTIVRETGDGLVVIDASHYFDAKERFNAVRSITHQRLNTAVYTHGHADHAFGVQEYIEEGAEKGWLHPRIIAHENTLPRFQRYREMLFWNKIINERQFQGREAGDRARPREFLLPNVTYANRLDICVGGVNVSIRHGKGETDDHTWVFFHDSRVLCSGDLFIWCTPNAGNPQKVQRYCREWVKALREMMAMEPKILAPGHGVPILGKERVKKALGETAEFMESIHEQTVALMNRGASLDTVIHTVKASEQLLNRPYLHPVYDDPEFIVRSIWRMYGGWFDGTPSHLKPAPERVQAEEIARLAGGVQKLVARAEELVGSGDLRLACHLADWAYLAAPEDRDVVKAVKGVYKTRAESEPSTMAVGIYLWAANRMEDIPESEKGRPLYYLFDYQDKRAKRLSED